MTLIGFMVGFNFLTPLLFPYCIQVTNGRAHSEWDHGYKTGMVILAWLSENCEPFEVQFFRELSRKLLLAGVRVMGKIEAQQGPM